MKKKNILLIYLVKEFSVSFSLALVFFCLIFMISEFFFRLSDFVNNNASFTFIFQYLALLLPSWIRDSLPVSVLSGLMFSMNRLSRDNEITAMKSCGINLRYVFMPFFLIGLLISIFGLFLNNKLIPNGFEKTFDMREITLYKHEANLNIKHKGIIYKSTGGEIFTIGAYDTKKNIMYDVTIDIFDNDLRLMRQVKAQKMTYLNNEWVLNRVVERMYANNGKEITSENYFSEKPLKMDVKPNDFVPAMKNTDMMTNSDLKYEINKLTNSSLPSTKLKVAYFMRYSYPFAGIVVMFLGIPFAIGLSGKYAKLRGIGYVLFISFFYWILMSFGRVLGEAGHLNTLLSAWLTNIIFIVLGFWLFFKMSR
ncbi:MAG: hypothetical protein A2252_01800 [Elusimicrobia bacterium RIFOXYA2_FULL_39_19]|nr:MAG: hypothetical protein A2252_01800 [Elusimicrobia bacterium RIFOXYA2_FULL_39_19]